jgi:MYXO-CTERM domain-containing protein
MIMQRWKRRAGVAAALLLALSVTTLGSPAAAQEGSPSGSPSGPASAGVQASPVVQQDDDTDVPWGLLGLLGLAGLAGLRRRPEPVRPAPATTRRL